jgi:hypothetical protein
LTPHFEQTVFFPACSEEIVYALPQFSHSKRSIGTPRKGAVCAGTWIAALHCLHEKVRAAYFSSTLYFLPQDGHSAVTFMDATPTWTIRRAFARLG